MVEHRISVREVAGSSPAGVAPSQLGTRRRKNIPVPTVEMGGKPRLSWYGETRWEGAYGVIRG